MLYILCFSANIQFLKFLHVVGRDTWAPFFFVTVKSFANNILSYRWNIFHRTCFCYMSYIELTKKVECHLQFSPTSGYVWFYRSLLWLAEPNGFNGMSIRTSIPILSKMPTFKIYWRFSFSHCVKLHLCIELKPFHSWCLYKALIMFGESWFFDYYWFNLIELRGNWNFGSKLIKIEKKKNQIGHFSCIVRNLLNQF